jgi:hypothetical protein
MAGWLAGLVMVGFTILVNKVLGNDPLYVVKLAASAWLDGPARCEQRRLI